MKPGQGTRSLIQGLYPGHETLIDRGFEEDPGFIELCEDYRRCSDALEDLRQPNGAPNPERVREYEELLAELGQELDGFLELLSQHQAQEI